MKHKWLLIFSILFLFLSCNRKETSTEINTSDRNADSEVGTVQSKPKVSPSKNMTILQVLDENLDNDTDIEQILVAKEENSIDTKVKIYVVDYDPATKAYYISFEGLTNATNVLSFKVTLQDIVGEHQLSIVCFGISKMDGQTLDIFHKTDLSATNCIYQNILSLGVQGSIDIIENKRDQDYFLEQTSGQSFDIEVISENHDESLNLMTKRIFKWNSNTRIYELAFEESFEKEKITNQQLNDLFKQDTENLLKFLTGSWVKEGNTESIIYFNIDQEEIMYYSEGILETYLWMDYYRIMSNMISANGQNEMIDYMSIKVNVKITSLNSIYIEIFDLDATTKNPINSERTGIYNKMAKSNFDRIFQKKLNKVQLPELTGFYKSSGGQEYLFESPGVTIHDESRIIKGGYALYEADVPVLEIKLFDENNFVNQIKCYGFEYQEEKLSGNRILRTISLVPGKITVDGFRKTDDEIIKLEQIEVIKK